MSILNYTVILLYNIIVIYSYYYFFNLVVRKGKTLFWLVFTF